VNSKLPKEKETIAAAVLEERQRIARELHDRALQLLSSARMRIENCQHRLVGNNQELGHELEIVEKNLDRAITEIRNLLAESQTEEQLQAGSLERRLRQELEIFRARTGFKLDFQCSIDTHDLPTDIEKELYFTLREGVLNAVRHSRATELRLSLARSKSGYEVKLSDNGVGFVVGNTEGSSHYGLKGMRERIESIGGKFTLQTAPKKGTKIEISIPVAKN
jgi:NarL family two-component system sensor histidine kinase LiaS